MCIKHGRSGSRGAGVWGVWGAGGEDSGGADRRSEDSLQGQTREEADAGKSKPTDVLKTHSSCGCDKDGSSVSGEGLHLSKLSKLGLGIRN